MTVRVRFPNDREPNRVSDVRCGVCLVQAQAAYATLWLAFARDLPAAPALDEAGSARHRAQANTLHRSFTRPAGEHAAAAFLKRVKRVRALER